MTQSELLPQSGASQQWQGNSKGGMCFHMSISAVGAPLLLEVKDLKLNALEGEWQGWSVVQTLPCHPPLRS
jgi:hypothetical protein